VPRKHVAKARQGQLVTTYGVGSVFPAGDQSYMIAGLDYWPRYSTPIHEPRLARALGVRSFRSPPSGLSRGDVPAMRFPTVHYCPKCHRLGTLSELSDSVNENDCRQCDRPLIPSRFVACCDAGHIEDFPYRAWVHEGPAGDGEHVLSLRALGRSSSLDDILVSCTCGARRSLAGAFGKQALTRVARCHGKRPWLPSDDPSCDRPLRTLQRGSSNVWFGSLRSSISIPPWSTMAAEFVEQHWQVLSSLTDEMLDQSLPAMLAGHHGLSIDTVKALITRRRGVDAGSPPTDRELRADEYLALRDGTRPGERGSFVCEPEEVAPALTGLVAQVSRVSRLREVRALAGFTRVVPPVPDADHPLAPLAEDETDWLPATEIHGEGIFIRLDETAVRAWETNRLATERAEFLTHARHIRDASLGLPPSPPVQPRFVALHSLAHVLVTELSLHAGYPVASLRERVYSGEDQAGILLYTASSDAAGSLGGLAALAHPDRLEEVVLGALEHSEWCSSDPVCAESRGSGTDSLNLAACHACLLLPETSCEHANLYLDRVMLTGGDHPEDGMLSRLRAHA